jgi:hypothetical protein
MRYVVVVLLLFIGMSYASAQDVYTSSGKTGYQKKMKKNKGYDPEKLIVGGGLNGGFGGGYANAGISPIVGYRFTNRFSAGVGVGYQFYKEPDYIDQNNNIHYAYENIVYPSVWARYFVWRNIFVDATFEYDFIMLQSPLDNYGNLNVTRSNVSNQCLLLGVGLKQPIAGRVSFFGELIYDVLQGEYSPYPHNGPDIRFGIAAGI